MGFSVSAAGVMVMLKVVLRNCTPASLTWMVTAEVPADNGVPLIVPLVASVRPPGSEPPTMLQASGVCPPVALSVTE